MEYIAHHGVKGQKWYVRRYQNYDGSLTPAGQIRYGSVSKSKVKIKKSSIKNHSDDTSDTSKIDRMVQAGAYFVYDLLTLNVPMAVVDAGYLVKGGADKLISRHKQKKMSELSENAETDNASGIKRKAKETTKEFDLKHTNPTYGDFKANSKNNCALCSIAYDMRRRGFEVTANTATQGYTISEVASVYKNAKVTHYSSDTPNVTRIGKEIRKELTTDLLSQGDGARGILGIHYLSGGHAVAYEVSDNKVYVMDAQIGKKANLSKYLNMNTLNVDAFRTDNLDVDYKYVKKAIK